MLDRTAVAGAGAGQLLVPDHPEWLSISPDGAWAAWIPSACLPYPSGTTGEPLFRFTDNNRSARTVRFEGWYGVQLAISSNAGHLALVIVCTDGTRRLVVLKTETGEVEHDVTELIARFDLKGMEHLQLSASGDRLVAGSRNLFSVVDVLSHKVLLEGEGRSPSLSPSGGSLAFVGEGRELKLTTVVTGATRRLLGRSTTHGVGAWTPDGTLLLAGVETRLLSLYWYLVAVDCAADACAEIARLEEHDPGQGCCFIRRQLLSADLPPC
jgi:hypothetical protein